MKIFHSSESYEGSLSVPDMVRDDQLGKWHRSITPPKYKGYYLVHAPGYYGKNHLFGNIAYSNYDPKYKKPWGITRQKSNNHSSDDSWEILHWLEVPKIKGVWVQDEKDWTKFRCSSCGYEAPRIVVDITGLKGEFETCPKCNAMMRLPPDFEIIF